MKTLLCAIVIWINFLQFAFAGGSVEWEEVKTKISKSDPKLVKVIERSFKVNLTGWGVRLGPQFGDRQGERIPPYEFYAKDKKDGETRILVIEESTDFQYTGRFTFTWKWPPKNDASDGVPGTKESGIRGTPDANPGSR